MTGELTGNKDTPLYNRTEKDGNVFCVPCK